MKIEPQKPGETYEQFRQRVLEWVHAEIEETEKAREETRKMIKEHEERTGTKWESCFHLNPDDPKTMVKLRQLVCDLKEV